MVGVFREVWRVLRDDGTVWLNLGDSYSAHAGQRKETDKAGLKQQSNVASITAPSRCAVGLKPKDLCGIPWRVAFALQADGWYLRSDIIWAKPNPMPESVTDRPTRSHEYIFLLSKRASYYYDSEAIREDASAASIARISQPNFANQTGGPKDYANGVNPSRSMRKTLENFAKDPGRNKRDVWIVNSEPTPEAHFATFPQKLIEPCILAGTGEKGCCAQCGAPRVRMTNISYDNPGNRTTNGARSLERRHETAGFSVWLEKRVETTGWRSSCDHDAPSVPCIVFDPFLGSGTVGKVCERLGRRWVGLELSDQYIEIAQKRTAQMGLFAAGAAAFVTAG